MSLRLLLVDDDPSFRERLAVSMTRRGFECRTAGDRAAALGIAESFRPEAILLDLRIGAENGLHLIPPLRRLLPGAHIVVLTGYGSIATAMEAVHSGANDYLTKPTDAQQLEAALSGARPPPELEVPSLDRVEWEHLQRVLADCDGNISQASRVLGIDRRSLQRKLSRIPPPR